MSIKYFSQLCFDGCSIFHRCFLEVTGSRLFKCLWKYRGLYGYRVTPPYIGLISG